MVEFILRKTNGRSTIKVWQSSPTPLEQKNLGTVFALIDIENDNALNEEIIDIITHDLQRYYYRSDSFEVEGAFENALHKLNRRLQELIGEIGEDWLGDVTAVLGVQKAKEVVVTSLGRAVAFMVHKQNVIDIIDTTQAKSQAVNPIKLFPSIVTGTIVPGAQIVFATESILDYLSKDRIRRLVQDYPGDQVTGALSDLLQSDTGTSNFAALVMDGAVDTGTGLETADPLTTTTPPATAAYSGVEEAETDSTPAEQSLRSLISHQSDTEEMLSPALWPRLKQQLKQRLDRWQAARNTDLPEGAPGKDHYEEHILNPAHSQDAPLIEDQWKMTLRRSLRRLRLVLGSAATVIGRSAQTSWTWLRQHSQGLRSGNQKTGGSRLSPAAGAGAALQRSSQVAGRLAAGASSPIKRAWQGLSTTQKAFCVVAMVSLLVLGYAILQRDEANTNSSTEQALSQTMAQVDLKINEGKAALVYNEAEARKLFDEAQSLLGQIPKDSQLWQQRGPEIERVLNEQLAIINKATLLSDITPIMDFGPTLNGAAVDAFAQIGNGVYAFAKDNSTVWRGDLEDKAITVAVSENSGTPGVRQAVQYSIGSSLLLAANNSLEIFSASSQEVTPIELPGSNTKDSITAMRVFASRLYTLNAEQNQIYRYDISGSALAAPAAWLVEEVDFSKAVSFAIDGSIYVLGSDGTVKLYSGGGEQDFTLQAVSPKLESANAIYTDENSDKLYIMDAAQHRVVVFDKKGKLSAQYTSPAFSNLRAMLVDEDNNQLFLLNGTQVYTIKLKK